MPTLGRTYLTSVLAAHEGPCVSIYLPTAKSHPDGRQNGIRFKNLVRAAEDALTKTNPGPTAREVVRKLRDLEGDHAFWGSPDSGAAILASPTRLDAFKLPRAVAERVEVGETFHVKPLIRHVQSADRFQVLGLSRERCALFEGDRYVLHPADAPGVPLTLADYLGKQVDEPLPGHREGARPGTRGGEAVVGGEGRGSREVALLAEPREYLRAVDRAVLDHVSNHVGLPVIPMGIDENLGEFRELTKNRFVTADAVHGDWTKWTLPEIRERAWGVFQNTYLRRLATIREDFGTASARNLATDNLEAAVAAVMAGRVGTLLVDADRQLHGSIDFTAGVLQPANGPEATVGDMLDDLAELALRHGSTVTVVPSDQMPTTTGLAAVFRF